MKEENEGQQVEPSVEERIPTIKLLKKPVNRQCSHPTSSFVFTSTKSDPEAMNIIYAHFKEFSEMAASNGFRMVIQYETDTDVTLRLTPLSSKSEFRKVVVDMEDLIKRKKDSMKASPTVEELLSTYKNETNERLDSIDNKLSQSVITVCQSSANNLTAEISNRLQSFVDITTSSHQQIATTGNEMKKISDELVSFKTSLDNQLKLQSENTKSMIEKFIEEHQVRNTVPETKSFFHCNIRNLLGEHPEVLDKLCLKLSNKDSDAVSPFGDIESMEEKKKALMRYLDSLQEDMSTITMNGDIRGTIAKWFTATWKQHPFVPSEEEKTTLKRTMNDRFAVNNVVGSVHLLPFQWKSIGASFLALAICDQKIVCWNGDSTPLKAVTALWTNLQRINWTDGLFATCYQIEKSENIFLYALNDEMFKENEKVITWMKANYKCLLHPITGDCGNSLPALYNMMKQFCDLH